MRRRLASDRLADEVKSLETDDAAAALLNRIKGPGAAALLDGLLQAADPTIRGWATWAAVELLGPGAVPLLLKATRDKNADVRDTALVRLLRQDPTSATSALPEIRRKLASADEFEVASALWTLAELRDTESLPVIESIRAAPRAPWLEKPAFVASLLIRGEADTVIAAIKAHDHRRMRELAHGAAILGTEEARYLLREVHLNPVFDEQCRRWCKWFLDWAGARHEPPPEP